MKTCPHCGSTNINIHYDDGGGDYGNSIVELYNCDDCLHEGESELSETPPDTDSPPPIGHAIGFTTGEQNDAEE